MRFINIVHKISKSNQQWIMRNSLYILLGLPLTQVEAQNYIMSSSNNGTSYSTCSGTFYDSGGAGGEYQNYENYTITFCSNSPGELLRIDFSEFNLENNYDELEVYYGNSAVGTPDLILSDNLTAFTLVEESSGDCITFRFTSDVSITRDGWVATLSCVTPCVSPIAAMVDDSTVNICADDPSELTVTVDGSASTSQDSSSITTYVWNWGDGTTTETSTPSTTHTYADEPAIYNINLTVRTDNVSLNPDGCSSTNAVIKKVIISPPPTFEGSTLSPQTVSCGESINLTGVASSQTIVSTPPPGTGSDTSLPDTTATPFESAIDLTGYFPIGATLSTTCLPELTLNMEHSWAGDLEIILIAPSGEEVYIFDGYGTAGISQLYFGYCVNGQDGTGPGCPAPYNIINAGGLDWTNPAALTDYTETCTGYTGACEDTGEYFVQDGTFNSAEPLANLAGADLNGVWTIRVIDNLGLDDGYLESWSIRFPTDCYEDLEIVTPIQTDLVWSHTGNGPAVPSPQTISDASYTTVGIDPCPTGEICQGNQLTNEIALGPFENIGSYIYTLTAVDEYGCDFTYDVTITVGAGSIEFDEIDDEYCLNDDSVDLPTTSANGIEGTWNPSSINTTILGESTYTFTPNNLECAGTYEFVVEIIALPITSIIAFD